MSDSKPASPKSRRGLAIASGVAIALLWTQMSGELMRLLAPNGIGGIAYGRSIAASLSHVIVMAVIVCMTAGIGLVRVGQVSGFTASVTRPLIVHAAVFGLATALCLTVAPLATDLSFADIAWLGFGSPITEEIVFRGLAIGALMRLAGWRFLPAIVAPAILFGVAHYAQGDGLVDSAAIIAITGLGGLVFGWLFVRWDFNLWPAIFAHIGMNTLWMVFALGENALGGWFGNALRLGVIGLLIAGALVFGKATRNSPATGQADGDRAGQGLH